jgi:hypothetical protein
MVRYWSSRQTIDTPSNPLQYSASRREPLEGCLADTAGGQLTARDKTPLVLSQILKSIEGRQSRHYCTIPHIRGAYQYGGWNIALDSPVLGGNAVSCAPPPESLGPAGAKGSESLRGGQAQFVSDGFVAGDGQAGGSRLPRVALGERLGSGQPHLVADRGVAGDSSKGFGSGAGVVAGELLGGGQAVRSSSESQCMAVAALCARWQAVPVRAVCYSTSLRTFCTWSTWSRIWASCMLISASFRSVCSWAVIAISDRRRYSPLAVTSAVVFLLMASRCPH